MTNRGDSLKNLETLKEAQAKVLQYFKLWTEKELIDPTPNKMWLGNKAKLMGLTLKKENLKNLPNAPEDFVCFITIKKCEETLWSRRTAIRGEFY